MTVSATGDLHFDRGALAGRRVDGESAADPSGAVPHGDQAEVASRPVDGARVEAAAVVGDGEQCAVPQAGEPYGDVLGPGVAQRVVEGLLRDAQHRLLLGGGQCPQHPGVEGDARGVGAVEDLDVAAEGVDEAVLVECGGAQLDDGGAELVRGLGGEGGDLLELALGAGGVPVDEPGGGLGGEAEGEELLADGVVQLVGQAGSAPRRW